MEGVDFNILPEGCISTLISLTSPQDACRSSLVSSIFRSAADSDVVWEKFLPSNYQQILSRSVSSVAFSTKKELFFNLINDPILIDGGNKSFSLERSLGKVCYLLSARQLLISGAKEPNIWSWKSMPESRFSEVAELRGITRLEIQGQINTHSLSPKTTYAAYLVMKLTDFSYGLNSIPSEMSVEVGSLVTRGSAYLCRNDNRKQWLEHLYYKNRAQILRSRVIKGEERAPQERNDGWMEIELGEFFNEGGDEVVKMSLMEVKGEHLKGGLIIEGIEVRPKA